MSILATATALAEANSLPSGQRAFSVCTLAMVNPAGVVVFDGAKLAAGDADHLAAVQTLLGITGAAAGAPLPLWTYTQGSLTAGLFTTNNTSTQATTTITLSAQALGFAQGIGLLFEDIPPGTVLLMADAAGAVRPYPIISVALDGSQNAIFTVDPGNISTSIAWSGNYAVSFVPGIAAGSLVAILAAAGITGFTGTDASGTYVSGIKTG